MTIGQVAKEAGVNVETIRFYQREGLVPQPPRRNNGFRQYSPEIVTRIRFIKSSQQLGFSLKEIVELLQLRVNPRMSCGDVRRRAEGKIADIERKTAELRRMKRALKRLAADCSGRGPTSQCPILEALESPKPRSHATH